MQRSVFLKHVLHSTCSLQNGFKPNQLNIEIKACIVGCLYAVQHYVKRFTRRAMDLAAEHGHFNIVQFLYVNRTEGCTYNAINRAAWNGHLKIVQFLHANKVTRCTEQAIDMAAARGHLNVVKWLFTNRVARPFLALNWAAENGHLDIVKWLYVHGQDKIADFAMYWAAKNGHFDIVKWLYAHGQEDTADFAMDGAVRTGQLDIARWLHANRAWGRMSYEIYLYARRRGQDQVADFVQHQYLNITYEEDTYDTT
jgi:hypothetical protein